MENTTPVKECPCGSEKSYSRCCEPFISGESNAPTAALLMRSRYTAYTLLKFDYIYATWHPKYRPSLAELMAGPHNSKWTGLKVIKAKKGKSIDTKGQVEFEARFEEDGQEYVLRELSDFVKIQNKWLYTKGR